MPESKTKKGWVIFLARNDMAATLVAKGQGLIEVKIPNHKADPKLIKISVTLLPLENISLLR